MRNPSLHEIQQDQEHYEYLVQRVGKSHLRQRLGVEIGHEADRFGQGRTFFNIENWKLIATLLTAGLKLTGLTARGRANVTNFQVRHNVFKLPHLPEAFEGFTLLHLSDLHFDSLPEFPDRLAEKVRDLDYDVCVLTGDFRFLTHGPHAECIRGLQRLCRDIEKDVYAVLGNHDSIAMAREIESVRRQAVD